ncbi:MULTISPECIES: enoyl-CoA hydratase-related protein [unclassified Herbaspirillum]|uniref:enoyl-CoA hydratase-related protein n=1 Tax=unclassified Herbaspirillum TaxID=2624150 RepID=UPI00114FC1B3|nr:MULTISPECIES: enoyl-CoA hydratase-related protein [unclassified Herbaspirillum]MBB5390901.1 methylglutaconyl-CoA hydratase [Herbaspirillum sp. SJZ102]TQK06425.1 methylglutaconyl-CoA hydratase [Herbaspirillum sp. SJZ130]TQK12097.1 methylglutaconyl-CoA hydratase [Herbaspirillum sp. SJZ106]
MTEAANLAIDNHGIATITLNRPDVHNAFDDKLIAHLIALIGQAKEDARTRVLLLASTGKSFSAGADLAWMRRMADASREDNLRDARNLALLMETLNSFPAPTVAKVQGAVMGGGVGLVSCCDIVIASEEAFFALSEVKLGLAPAAISPYVVAKMGVSQARRYFVSGERFSAIRAAAIGLVHEVVLAAELDAKVEHTLDVLLGNGPQAMRAAKQLAQVANPLKVSPELAQYTAGVIADLRASDEGKEGLRAFLEKGSPAWAIKR